MNTTMKWLLGIGATGVATWLLWRFWPKKEEVYIPPQTEYGGSSYYNPGTGIDPDGTPAGYTPGTDHNSGKGNPLGTGTYARPGGIPGTAPNAYTGSAYYKR